MGPMAWIKGRLGCLRGSHERSVAGVHHVENETRSHCRFCGVAMLRKAKRRWVVIGNRVAARRLEWDNRR